MFRLAAVVFAKELRDALRDRRTLLAVVVSSVAVGPLMLVLLSGLLSTLEERARSREIVVAGAAYGPTLVNFLQRQTLVLEPAPADYERQLVAHTLGDAVLVIPPDFERELAAGLRPTVLLIGATGNTRAAASRDRVAQALQAFNLEQARLRLAMRGVAAQSLEAVRVDERDLANPRARSAQLTSMLPYFVLMAVLYGALNAALDTTAGERERGSLEPLLTNPAPRLAIVLGKWAAVTSVGMLIAVLSCFSFLPGQWLLRSESLAALFRYGPREAVLFLALLLPMAALLSAILMAVAIRCRSVKEAQANATAVLLAVSLLPLLSLFDFGGEKPWHLAVPALAQVTLMGRVLRGEVIAAADLLLPLAVAAAITALCVAFVARSLRSATTR
jgi:sodium transport system permease protein